MLKKLYDISYYVFYRISRRINSGEERIMIVAYYYFSFYISLFLLFLLFKIIGVFNHFKWDEKILVCSLFLPFIISFGINSSILRKKKYDFYIISRLNNKYNSLEIALFFLGMILFLILFDWIVLFTPITI
jgi:hypothetical protein